MPMELELSNIVTISVSQNPQGVGRYNTSNLAIFSNEEYDVLNFGSNGYKIYLEPSEVATDFGSSSVTYQMALAIFSQQPNILAGNGYLVILPMITEVTQISFDLTPTSGAFDIDFGTDDVTVNWDDTIEDIQTNIRLISGLEKVLVEGAIDDLTGLTLTFFGSVGNVTAPTITNNTLADGSSTAVSVTVSTTTQGETLDAAILRTKDLVQYFGILPTFIVGQVTMLATAALVQTLIKIIGFVSRTEADIDPAGRLDLLRSGGFSHSRGLYYGEDNDLDALLYSAAYFGRGLSTNFDGSNTTQTQQLKDLITIQPDPSMTQTIYNKCKTAGVDIYVSFQGVAKIATSGANSFWDQVYNLLWFVGALEVAGFNYLAEVATKVPQTENGMDGLKGAYRKVCEQAVTNAYSAPGVWNSATTFGNQAEFIENIAQRGYYIFSVPVALQSQVAREDREAPLVQIALKEAGAIHSSTVIVNINA